MATQDPGTFHPSEAQLASYLAGDLGGAERSRLEAHLATCADCRGELIDSSEILRAPRRIPWRILAPVAAAAAIAVLVFPNAPERSRGPDFPVHRQAPTDVRAVPTPHSPAGSVDEVGAFVWARVEGADRYRVTLFDSTGTLLWETVTPDSLAVLPEGIELSPDRRYLWRVEARTGWDVWERSDFTDFRLEPVKHSSPDPGGGR